MLLLSGDFFLGGVVGSTLCKLVLRLHALGSAPQAHRAAAQAMLQIASILRLGESKAVPHPVDDDAVDRMAACLKVGSTTPATMWQVEQGWVHWHPCITSSAKRRESWPQHM